MECLHRFLLINEWFEKGFEVESFILKGALSDHCPICLDISDGEKAKNVPFRFKGVQHDHPDLENRIAKVMEYGKMFILPRKLQHFRKRFEARNIREDKI